MSQAMTNYTTSDLAYYYADLARLPRFSEEERQQLLTQTTCLDAHTRNRIVEGHLRLATHVAIDRCPPAFYRSLPDIVGEVALTLVKVAQRSDVQRVQDFTAYMAACTDGAVKRALAHQYFIKIPHEVVARARQEGTLEQISRLQPVSLDALMHWDDTNELDEPSAAPLLPTDAAPPRDPHLCTHIQTWFAYLSPRAQNVLTLRYGLSEEDEHALTFPEIAVVTGLKLSTVRALARDAIKRIRALLEGTATLTEKNGHSQITGVYQMHLPTLTPEDENTLMQAATHLCEQGIVVSIRTLVTVTGKSRGAVRVFLRAHRDALPSANRPVTHQERLEHVARVCAEQEAQGEPITVKYLAKVAHVRKETVSEFLRGRKGVSHAQA